MLLAQSRAGQGALSEIPSSHRKRNICSSDGVPETRLHGLLIFIGVGEEELNDFSFQLL